MTSITTPGQAVGHHVSGSPTPEEQLDRLLRTVAIAPLLGTGWIRVTGGDRLRWLNGMVTNSIQQLQPNEGNYSFVLNAQGQIQGDLTAFAAEPDALLLEGGCGQVPGLISLFDRFIIMDDVELEDLSPKRFGLLLAGPAAALLLHQLGPASAETNGTALHRVSWRDVSVDVVAAHAPLVPRFELWSDESTHQALFAELTRLATGLNGGPVDDDALEHLRLLEGTPKYGIDILPKNLAQETGQTRALHFSKGCYLGQEIVERIHSRGNIHRTFAGFRLEGPLPGLPVSLTSSGKTVGELTSASSIPLLGAPIQIGLGIVRREALDRDAPIEYATPEGSGTATAIPLPILPSSR